MKQGNIKDTKAVRKREAVYGILVFAVLQIVCAIAFGSLCFMPDIPKGVFWCFFVLAGLCLILVVPALFTLKERFKEIEGGELDVAGKY